MAGLTIHLTYPIDEIDVGREGGGEKARQEVVKSDGREIREMGSCERTRGTRSRAAERTGSLGERNREE